MLLEKYKPLFEKENSNFYRIPVAKKHNRWKVWSNCKCF